MTAPGITNINRLALNLDESAEALGMSLSTFNQKVRPHLRIVRMGRTIVVPVSALEEWLDANSGTLINDYS